VPRGNVSEPVASAVAVVGLISLGVVLRTPILNWISGPAFVVTVVTLLARERRS
jgi:hypothetical protein